MSIIYEYVIYIYAIDLCVYVYNIHTHIYVYKHTCLTAPYLGVIPDLMYEILDSHPLPIPIFAHFTIEMNRKKKSLFYLFKPNILRQCLTFSSFLTSYILPFTNPNSSALPAQLYSKHLSLLLPTPECELLSSLLGLGDHLVRSSASVLPSPLSPSFIEDSDSFMV